MQPISLLKRLVYYVLLIILSLLGLAFCAFSGGRENGMAYLFVCVFIIPQYIFSLIFLLYTNSFLKFIVPLITALVSFGSLWLISFIEPMIDYPDLLFYIIMFLPIVLVWEIVYQILKAIYKKDYKITNQNSETC